jgi:hypothetical protein
VRLFLLTGVIIASSGLEYSRSFSGYRESEIEGQPNCRFGITAPLGIQGYDLRELGVGSYLDWGGAPGDSRPAGIEYIHVLRLRDDLYPATFARLDSLLSAYPGAYWIVGNEPDTTYEQQDGVTPEVYAERFYKLARKIRRLDPTAKIGFGSIVQPTPLRIRYLERAWIELIALAGSQEMASRLIDFWNIHAFILNEWPGEWGTGIPPGFESDFQDAVHFFVPPFAETHSLALFSLWVEQFRAWLADIGEREKPLWITEYGSLFPPLDPPDGTDLVNVTDQETIDYMSGTFDFLRTAIDLETGMPGDGYRLVQRWYWYSLNDHRYTFGGSLYDPDNSGELTPVGQAFIRYLRSVPGRPDVLAVRWERIRDAFIEPGEFRQKVRIQIANVGGGSTAGGVQVWFYSGHPRSGGELLRGPVRLGDLMGCGDSVFVSIPLEESVIQGQGLYVLVRAGQDVNPFNDLAVFDHKSGAPEAWLWGWKGGGVGVACGLPGACFISN